MSANSRIVNAVLRPTVRRLLDLIERHALIGRKSLVRRGASAALLVGIALPSAAAPLIYFSVTDAQLGTATAPVLVPRTFEASASTGEQRIRAVFDQLRSLRPQIYGAAQLTVGSDFDVTGQVSVQVQGLTEEEVDQLASEVYTSFTVHGASAVIVSPLGGAPLSASQVAYPSLQPVVPAWEALPPRRYDGAVIALPNGEWLSSASFYDRLKKRDKALGTTLLGVLSGANSAAKARLLASLGELAVDDPSTAVLGVLSDPSPRAKLAAVKALDAQKSNPKVKAALAEVVDKDPDPEVKAAAVRVLIAAGEKKYEIFSYIERLKDPNDATVLDAVQKLAASGSAAVAPALADTLGHSSVEVREAALKGLVTLKNGDAMSRALDGEKVAPDMKLAVAKAMTGSSDDAVVVRGLSHIAANGNAADAQRAAEGLGSLKATAGVKSLALALENSSESVRAAAAKALGEIGSAEALPALAKMASRSQPTDREAGAAAALRILTAQPQSAVIEQSRSEDVGVRRLAIMALAGFGDGGRNRAVVGVLRERLSDPSPEIKQAAVYALARIPDEGVASELLALRNDSDPVIRAQVATSLGWSKSGSAVQSLIEMMGDSSSEVKQAAAESVAQQKASQAMDTLLQYVAYGKPEVRRAVFRAIGAIATPSDLERLIDVYSTALYDQDTEVKQAAVEGISTFKDPRTVTALSGLTIDPDPAVQKLVLARLGAFKDPSATESIARALFSEDKSVRMAALDALAAAGQDNAQKALQEFIKNETDPDLRAKANQVYDSL